MQKLKDELLALLVSGEAFRGEELAAHFSVTRAAIWKAVQELRAQGIPVEANRTHGYQILKEADVFCEAALQQELPQVPLQWHEKVDSTNLQARRWAEEGAPHGALVVAAEQIGGRGRMGRQFHSPKGGLYLSVILRPNEQKQGVSLLTAAAAVAVCRSIKALCAVELQIKWVNDLFYKGKKCAGILTEGVSSLENGGFEHLICGIGINYALPSHTWKDELVDIATSLYTPQSAPYPRAVVIGELYRKLMFLYEALPDRAFLDEYRACNIVPGKRVRVLQGKVYEAEAFAIDDDAHLLVKLDDGEIRSLGSGEVSIRPLSSADDILL